MKRGYQDQFFDKHFEWLSAIERESLLTPKPNNASSNRIPLVLKFSKTLSNIKEIVKNIGIYFKLTLTTKIYLKKNLP